MEFKRGFKSRANEIARENRQELGVGVASPLNPWKLAEHLAIRVVPLSSFRGEAREPVLQLARRDPSAFSAVTICRGYKRLIVINDSHHPNRQASSLAHELAHILLWHCPAQTFEEDGVREWNAEQESEAHWLAGALLISDEAALEIVRKRQSLRTAAAEYGVSQEMITFRLNVTGARQRVARARLYRRTLAS